ncbi:GlpM family protein [bacterium]|nr:GlpM family protein [bacterium]
MNEFALRFIAGGSLITIVSLISKCKYPYISGLFMMFPAVTLVGYYFVSGNVTPLELKSITVFSLVSLVTVAVFIVSFYVFQSKYDVIFALLLSLLCWSVSAGVIVFLSRLW